MTFAEKYFERVRVVDEYFANHPQGAGTIICDDKEILRPDLYVKYCLEGAKNPKRNKTIMLELDILEELMNFNLKMKSHESI